jgi:hypothetical protein
LEQCNTWSLVTQSSQQGNSYNNNSLESSASYGALAGHLNEACSIVLRNVMYMVVAGDPGLKEESSAALEAAYRHHLTGRVVEACTHYGSSLSGRCVAAVLSGVSELVLTSSKFLVQV